MIGLEYYKVLDIIIRGQNRETQIIPWLHSFVFHNYSYA